AWLGWRVARLARGSAGAWLGWRAVRQRHRATQMAPALSAIFDAVYWLLALPLIETRQQYNHSISIESPARDHIAGSASRPAFAYVTAMPHLPRCESAIVVNRDRSR